MKKILISFLILALLFITSCGDSDFDPIVEVRFRNGSLQTIRFDYIPERPEGIKMSEVFTGIESIPLETKAECVIGNTSLVFSENNIFVGTQDFPRGAKLYRFDKNGLFINEIGKDGNGPGEHTGYLVRRFYPSESDQTILVNWEGGSDDPQIFGLDGTFLGEIKFPLDLLGDIYEYSGLEWFSTGSICGHPFYERDSVKLIFYDKKGKILHKIPRTVYPASDGFTPLSGMSSVYRYEDEWRLYLPGLDTIYNLVNRELRPAYALEMGKGKMPYNLKLPATDLPGKFFLEIVAENENNMLLLKNLITEAKVNEYQPGKWSTSSRTEPVLVIIDKKSNKAIQGKLTDDMLGFLPEEYLKYGLKWENDKAFLALQAINYIKLKSEIKSENATKDLNEINIKLSGITETSNPVIFKFKLRERIRID